jgi:hypothetical protein
MRHLVTRPSSKWHGSAVARCSPAVPINEPGWSQPFPLRFPLAFDGKLLGHVLRIFTDTVVIE